MAKFKAAIKEADGVLFATAEYNYGIPGRFSVGALFSLGGAFDLVMLDAQ